MPTYVLPVKFPAGLTPAISSDSVLDRFSVQVHMAFYTTPYNDPTQVISLLTGLHARTVRDNYNDGFPTQHARMASIGAAGIKFIMTARLSDTVTSFVNGIRGLGGDSTNLVPYLRYLEGINEPDNAGGSWVSNTRTHQQALYPAIKAIPALVPFPVLAPALANEVANAASLGDLSAYCDYGNAHVYSGNPPSSGLGSYTNAARVVAGATKPVIISEQGYHNLLASGSSIRPVDEAAAGSYAPKILLENIRQGNTMVSVYELIDQGSSTTDAQNHYGLCHPDYTPKPAYTAISNLLGALSDPGVTYTPSPLALTITPPVGNTDLRSLLCGRRDGSYQLVLWRDVSVWNPTAQTDTAVASASVTVAYPGGTQTVSVGTGVTIVTIPHP